MADFVSASVHGSRPGAQNLTRWAGGQATFLTVLPSRHTQFSRAVLRGSPSTVIDWSDYMPTLVRAGAGDVSGLELAE